MAIDTLVRRAIERDRAIDHIGQLLDQLAEEDWSLRSELVAGLAAAKG